MSKIKITYEELLKKTKAQEIEINKLIENQKQFKKLLNKKKTVENTDKNIFNALLDYNDSIILVMDENLNTFFRSSSTARVTGWKDEAHLDNHIIDYIHPEHIPYIKEMAKMSLHQPKIPIPVSLKIKHSNGTYIWVEGFFNNRIEDENVKGIIVNLKDVTETKKSIELISEEKNKFDKIAATSSGLIFSMEQKKDKSLFFIYASDAFNDIFGFSVAVFNKYPGKVLERLHKDDLNLVLENISNSNTNLSPLNNIYRYFHPTKGLVWHEANALPTTAPEGSVIFYGITTDITERVIAEQKIVKANRLYQFISQISQMIVRVENEETLFKEACSIAVNVGEFKMSWIGLINEKTGIIEHQMIAGDDDGYVTTIQKFFKGNSSRFEAIKKEKYIVVNNIATDQNMNEWKVEALKRNFNSLMIVPIKRHDKTIGVFCFYSSEIDFFDAEEIVLLNDATSDVGFALEIFEKEKLRKKALKEVTESENRYHILTEMSPVGIFRTDATGYTTYVNPRWTEISGLPFEKALGNGWLDAVYEEDKISLQKGWEDATEQSEVSFSEYRFVRPDGTIVWVMGQAIPERNQANEIVGYVGTTTNITERKRVEEDLKQSYQRLESIIDSIPDLLIEVDIDGRIYNYHSHKEDLLSHATTAIIGKNLSEVLPIQAVEAFKIALTEVAQNGFSIGKQYQLELSNGKYWFELSIAPMEDNVSSENHFICLSKDITTAKLSEIELQKSRERYKNILNNLDAGIVVQNPEGSIVLNNLKAAELLGNNDEVLHSNWTFLNEDGSNMSSNKYPFNQVLKTRKPIKNLIIGVSKPNIETITWLLFNIFSVTDSNNNVTEVVSSFIDVSEQKILQNEILKGKQQAESANKAKTDFLANMSHEIRTPLNGIIGFTDLLLDSDLNKTQLEYMSTINESASSLLNIVNDVLDFSKIEAGKFELDIDEVDLYELSQQVIDLFKYQTLNKKLNLVLNIEVSVPKYILADVVRLKQILMNLLSNAFKFTEFGEIQLNISEIQATKKKTTLHFSVSDTGIGIKTDNNKKIFDSFVQEDNSTSRKFGGTGLGLAITNQLLALMDSKLELKSEFGEGSTFFFTISFFKIKERKKPETKTKTTKNLKFNELNNFKNQSVLLVEDNKINMLLAKTLIQNIYPNITLFEAHDGNEAIAVFKNEKIDLILMDVQMPNKNGYEATDEIRKLINGTNVPIVSVTAGILANEKEKCFEAGMNDYLSKPIIKKDLKAILEKWLN